MNESIKKALEFVGSTMNADTEKLLEAYQKSMDAVVQKSQTDIMGIANPGFGAEVRRSAIFKDPFYDIVDRNTRLLQYLPSNFGQVENTDSIKVPRMGNLGYFQRDIEASGNPEFHALHSDDAIPNNEIVIKFQKLQKKVAITIEELTRYIGGEDQMYAIIQDRLSLAFAHTIDSYIINGDSDITSANINGLPVVSLQKDHRFGEDGLRKEGILNGVVGANTAYSSSLLVSMQAIIEDHIDDTDHLLWINSNRIALKMKQDPAYRTINLYGPNATNVKGGFLESIEGIQPYQTKNMPSKVKSDGKIDFATPANNNHNGSLLIWTPCVHYAYGLTMRVIPHVESDKILFDCTGYFGFTVDNTPGGNQTVAYGVTPN